MQKCGWCRRSETVHLSRRGETHHIDQTVRCGSAWACPVCAATISARRGTEVREALEAAVARGWTMLFITVTLRHHARSRLSELLPALCESWTYARQGSRWQGTRTRPGLRHELGYQGGIRGLELTTGNNGPHPHIHAVFLLDREPDAASIAALREHLESRYFRRLSQKHDQPEPLSGVGIQIKLATSSNAAGAIARYLVAAGLSQELTSSAEKQAHPGHRTYWQVIEDYAHRRRPADRQLWTEYITATAGRSLIHYSPGLRAALGLLPEEADAALVEDDGPDDALVLEIPAADWDRVVHEPHFEARLLDAADIALAEGRDPRIDAEWVIGETLAHVLERDEREAAAGLPRLTPRARARARLQADQPRIETAISLRIAAATHDADDRVYRREGMILPAVQGRRAPLCEPGFAATSDRLRLERRERERSEALREFDRAGGSAPRLAPTR